MRTVRVKYKSFGFAAISFIIFSIISCVSTENAMDQERADELDDGVEVEVKISSNNYKQIATGQTKLYDADGNVIEKLKTSAALYGQDANYLKGNSMSYKDNDDGTVTDLNTGLVWQQVPFNKGFEWKGAVDYCKNLEFAGYSDWRIPSLKELFSISNFENGWPYIDTNYFSLATNTIEKHEQFWSANKYTGVTLEGQENSAFGVNHVTGHIKSYPAGRPNSKGQGERSQGGPPQRTPPPGDRMPPPPQGGNRPIGNPMQKYVRAVRGDAYGINDFKDNGDETITDRSSGLMWSKDDSKKGMDWLAALAYAEKSKLAGYTDWRLPNVKELQGVVDYSKSPGAVEASNEGAAINKLFRCTPFVNEAGKDDFGYYWTSTSARFQAGKPFYYAWYVAFGRAVNNEGKDVHGAGAVRFDAKHEGGPAGEGAERYFNFVRMVRDVK